MNRNKGSVQGLFRWVGVGVLVFVAGTPPAMGQAQVFPQWTARLHFANASVSPVTIAADAQGNSFSTGAVCLERTDTSCLNAESLTLKYDADGNLKWKRFLSSPVHQATGVDVGADAAGNAYVLSLLWLGQDQVNGLKDAEFVTAKYDPAGVRLWIDFFHIPNTDNIPVKLAVGATGAVYVTGTTV
jgi:hypothetical protein